MTDASAQELVDHVIDEVVVLGEDQVAGRPVEAGGPVKGITVSAPVGLVPRGIRRLVVHAKLCGQKKVWFTNRLSWVTP